MEREDEDQQLECGKEGKFSVSEQESAGLGERREAEASSASSVELPAAAMS